MGKPQIIEGNSRRNMVRDMYIDVVAQPLNPAGIITMHCASELGCCPMPFVWEMEGNVGHGVMDNCKGAHPKVIDQPRQELELDHAPPPSKK